MTKRRPLQRSVAGFTMVELMVTMIIVGILAVAVVPRFEALGAFDATGFRNQTIATLRFAQKTALAQRRAVCVMTTPTSVRLFVARNAEDNNACDDGIAFNLPYTTKAGKGLQERSFNYLRHGETDQANDVILTLAEANNIVVDRVTGYVR
jgi:MSHA pilin protein MshC